MAVAKKDTPGNPRSRSEILTELSAASRALSTASVLLHTAVAEHLGLSGTDHKAADLIMRLGPMTAGELAEYSGLTSGAITGLVDRLEAAGWVKRERDPSDRRRVIITATNDPEITARAHSYFEKLDRSFRRATQSYTDDELELMLKFFRDSAAFTHAEARKIHDERSAAP